MFNKSKKFIRPISILLCLCMAAMAFLFSIVLAPKDETPTIVTAADATPGTLDLFDDGGFYSYTNYNFSSSTESIETVSVSSSDAEGSRTNPFVINSTDDWNTFAAKVNSGDSTLGIKQYGTGQYFCLNSDLDFSGVTITPIESFAGYFIGAFKTIKNANIPNSTTSAEDAGLFVTTRGSNAFFTDLVLKDFKIQTNNTTATSNEKKAIHSGGLIGHAGATANTVINCTANGSISGIIRVSSTG